MLSMRFFNIIRSFGHRKSGSNSLILPSDWPSDLHSKCSVPACWYPNPPQAAEGQYNCLGHRSDGRQCKGVYTVTSSMAMVVVKNWERERAKARVKARQKVEGERARKQGDVRTKPSRPYTLARVSQKLRKEKSFRGLEYRKDKNLPGIPGLSQRRLNKGPPRPPFSPNPTQARADPGLYPEVHLRCIFPKDQSAGFSQPGFSSISQKPDYTSFRTPVVATKRTLSRDLGFTSNSRDSLSVYSQMTNARWRVHTFDFSATLF